MEIAQEMKGNCVMLAKGYNGGFVIQKCINAVNSSHLSFIPDEFAGHVCFVSLPMFDSDAVN